MVERWRIVQQFKETIETKCVFEFPRNCEEIHLFSTSYVNCRISNKNKSNDIRTETVEYNSFPKQQCL